MDLRDRIYAVRDTDPDLARVLTRQLLAEEAVRLFDRPQCRRVGCDTKTDGRRGESHIGAQLCVPHLIELRGLATARHQAVAA